MQKTEKYIIHIHNVSEKYISPEVLVILWRNYAYQVYQRYNIYIPAILSTAVSCGVSNQCESYLQYCIVINCTRNPNHITDKIIFNKALSEILGELVKELNISHYSIDISYTYFAEFILKEE